MEFEIVQVYTEQVLQQCQFIIMAHVEVRRAAAKSAEAFQVRKDRTRVFEGLRMGKDADRELWYSVQGLMSASANVTKVLWGTGENGVAAREPVREALGVTDAAIWQQARKFRNNFDHYDERIQDWAKSKEGLKVEGVGGPPVIVGHTRRAQWRNYDPKSDTLHFWGAELSLGVLEVEARRLIPAAEHVLSLCGGCVDEERAHPVVFPRIPEYPTESNET